MGKHIMEPSKSAMQALIDIFVSPNAAYMAIEKNKKWFWWPLLLIIVSAVGLWAWYYNFVDIDWFQEHTLAASGKEMTPEQMEQAKKFMQRGTMMGTTIAFVTIFVVLIYLIEALYFHVVAKVSGDQEHGFGDWFNFCAWGGMPGLISVIAGAVVLLTAGTNQIGQEQLQPLALNNLIFNLPLSHPWANFLSSINLPLIWTIVLMGIGLALWSKRSLGKSITIAAAPYVVIFGIWAAILALK